VDSFTPRTLYPRRNTPLPRYPSDRRLGEPYSRYGRGGEEKISHHCREFNPGRPARSLVSILTEQPRLLELTSHGRIIFLHFSTTSGFRRGDGLHIRTVVDNTLKPLWRAGKGWYFSLGVDHWVTTPIFTRAHGENYTIKIFTVVIFGVRLMLLGWLYRKGWDGKTFSMREGNLYQILVGRPRRRWEDTTKMDLREVVYKRR
jgi:hypothetical protein